MLLFIIISSCNHRYLKVSTMQSATKIKYLFISNIYVHTNPLKLHSLLKYKLSKAKRLKRKLVLLKSLYNRVANVG